MKFHWKVAEQQLVGGEWIPHCAQLPHLELEGHVEFVDRVY